MHQIYDFVHDININNVQISSPVEFSTEIMLLKCG